MPLICHPVDSQAGANEQSEEQAEISAREAPQELLSDSMQTRLEGRFIPGFNIIHILIVCDESSSETATDEPDIIPLNLSGTVDTEMSAVTVNEMMLWGLINLWQEGKEGGYAVRHSRNPVCDYPQHNTEDGNYFEKAFPCLYPYGMGGIEAIWDKVVEFREHIRWSLQYYDCHFRRHETFPFVAFGISQRRQALASMSLQMCCKNFEQDAQLMATITLAQLCQACQEEKKNMPISNQAIQAMHHLVHTTAGRVMGSDQAQCRLHS